MGRRQRASLPTAPRAAGASAQTLPVAWPGWAPGTQLGDPERPPSSAGGEQTALCPGGRHLLLPQGYLLQSGPAGRALRTSPVARTVTCAAVETPGVTPHPKHPPWGAGQTEPTFRGGDTEEGRVETVPRRFIKCRQCRAQETDTAVNERTGVPDAQRFHSSPDGHIDQPGGGTSPRASPTGEGLDAD